MLNLDTHILIYALSGDLTPLETKKLSDQTWSISAIVLWEIEKLHSMGRIRLDLEDPELSDDLARLHIWPITIEICRSIRNLDFKSDPADEMISSTSLVHKVPLLTRDRRILRSKVVPLAK